MIDAFVIWMMVSFMFIGLSMVYTDVYNPSDKLSKLEIIAFVTSPGMPIFVIIVLLLQNREINILKNQIKKMENGNYLKIVANTQAADNPLQSAEKNNEEEKQ